MVFKICNKVENIIKKYGTNDPETLCSMLGIGIKPVGYGTATYFGGDANTILINQNYSKIERMIVLAHELGHVVLHSDDGVNHFRNSESTLDNIEKEHQANLFAAYLLFDDSKLEIKFSNMNSYLLNAFLDDICNAG